LVDFADIEPRQRTVINASVQHGAVEVDRQSTGFKKIPVKRVA
jgi:hypothetical protein